MANDSPNINLSCLSERLAGHEQKIVGAGFFWKRDALSQVVELVVDAVDPKIRLVSRYQKKLKTPIELAWQYLNEHVQFIPGTLEINEAAYRIDPRVRNLFESVDAMQAVFSNAYELTEFFAELSNNALKYGYALLCMQKKEKTFFGVDLETDILRRDVQQTAVTFFDHKILSAAPNEEEARNGFRCCAFEGLLRKAVERIVQEHGKYRALEERKRKLTTELHHIRGSEVVFGDTDVGGNGSEFAIKRELEQLNSDIIKTKTETAAPGTHLGIVAEVLSHPENYLKIKAVKILLNNMGIKLAESSKKQGYELELAELQIENSLNRVATVVRYPRDEMG